MPPLAREQDGRQKLQRCLFPVGRSSIAREAHAHAAKFGDAREWRAAHRHRDPRQGRDRGGENWTTWWF